MKNVLLSFTVICLVIISSCNGKTSAIVENVSANGKAKIKITATRSNVMEPFKTEISVKAYNFKEGKLIFEISKS